MGDADLNLPVALDALLAKRRDRSGPLPRPWFAALLAMTGLLWVIDAPHAAEPGPLPITPDNLSAVLNTDSYGYDLACFINGHDVGIVGGKSEGMRLFDEATREESTDGGDRHTYSALHLGRNNVRITYRRRLRSRCCRSASTTV